MFIGQNMSESCAICGLKPEETKQGYLVRDHNHDTGVVRGLLCTVCNSYLGVYEKHLAGTRKKPLRRNILAWIEQYRSQIERHLQSSTDEPYVRR
jgi:hypothetical protein